MLVRWPVVTARLSRDRACAPVYIPLSCNWWRLRSAIRMQRFLPAIRSLERRARYLFYCMFFCFVCFLFFVLFFFCSVNGLIFQMRQGYTRLAWRGTIALDIFSWLLAWERKAVAILLWIVAFVLSTRSATVAFLAKDDDKWQYCVMYLVKIDTGQIQSNWKPLFHLLFHQVL